VTDVLRLPDGIVACRGLSAGCLVIGSDTPPVSEVIDGRNGILVPFFDIEQLSERVIGAWAHPRRFAEFRARAHRTAVEQFDMERKCLPQLLALLRGEAPRLPGGGNGSRANAKYGGRGFGSQAAKTGSSRRSYWPNLCSPTRRWREWEGR